MNGPRTPDSLARELKTLWGATHLPFGAAVSQAFASPSFTQLTQRLSQLVAVRACGMLYGPNGAGKSLLVGEFLRSLPEKRYKSFTLCHCSLSGSDLLRLLCMELGRTPRMRRSDNLAQIRAAWKQLDRLWPVLCLDEAQNLSATSLEEIRLLCCDRRDTQAPFSLLLVGDKQLLARLQMGVNAPLLDRLGFCLPLAPLDAQESRDYIQARLEEAAIHSNPFEEAALDLLIRSADGRPRLINHLAQRSIEAALAQDSSTISTTHIHNALELMPWVAKL